MDKIESKSAIAGGQEAGMIEEQPEAFEEGQKVINNKKENAMEAGKIVVNANAEANVKVNPLNEADKNVGNQENPQEEALIKNGGEMKKLLFIEGNRSEIDKLNVKGCHSKMEKMGYIKDMPIEYVPIKIALEHLNGRKLYTPSLKRKDGEGQPILSNFEVITTYVEEKDYRKYEGVCIDGQHRTLALMFGELHVKPIYKEVDIPKDVDIVQYISLRNTAKPWANQDFYDSGILTGDHHVDHILAKRQDKFIMPFLLCVYTLGTSTLTPRQIKDLQLGVRKMDDIKRVQLTKNTEEMGDAICQICKEHQFLTSDNLTGRFGAGLKDFYKKHDSDFEKVKKVLNGLNKAYWERYFSKKGGHSMEVKAYEEAFSSLLEDLQNN